LYEWLRDVKPNREKALAHAAAYDFDAWCDEQRRLFPSACEELIELERNTHKFEASYHAKRLEVILEHWDEIMQIAKEELPERSELEKVYRMIGEPMMPKEIGINLTQMKEALYGSMSIRDKYICSRLLWDIGEIDEMADKLYEAIEAAQAE